MSMFHLFSLLPLEIRIRIWNFALNTPTIVQLCFTPQEPFGWYLCLVSRTIPPLLHASSESRSQALKIFPTELPGLRNTYINLALDTVVLGSAAMPFHFEWVTETLAFRDSLDLSRIRHLAIHLNWWRSFDVGVCLRLLTWFSSVESLILFIEDADGGQVRFAEIEDGDEGLLWDYDHEVEFGVRNACRKDLEALKRSFEVLEHEQHEGFEDYEFVADWKMPELKAMKLKGKILNQVSKELAIEKGWRTIGA